MLYIFSKILLKVLGWEVILKLPEQKKYVIIAAPHTSNWDFFFFILLLWSTRLKFEWAGKHTIFKGPAGFILKKMGGIPINRSIKNNLVNKIVEKFNNKEEYIFLVAPEGTRSKIKYWKAGFYYIAKSVNVPIVLGFIDYKTKTIGFDNSFFPSEKLEDDINMLKDFYGSKTGLHPEKYGEPKFQLK
ncbi:MAG: lysophospholipid acyltransferase family protein [Bacteroidetes bacterium]|nr:lysophospholipid acyltransferase family protein [Bacteroidota bacterium]MCH8325419.1 lysophospholipid acyltransferase family protein [Bacteroidota bacterium]